MPCSLPEVVSKDLSVSFDTGQVAIVPVPLSITVSCCRLGINNMRLVYLETGGFDEKMLTIVTVV